MAPTEGDAGLRVVAWNCRAGLTTKKAAAIEALGADVVVICELQSAFVPLLGRSLLVRDATARRGRAVMSRLPVVGAVEADDPGLPWLLPVRLEIEGTDPLTLLALWTVQGEGSPSYVRQAQAAITAWDEACAASRRQPWHRTILAGDFNASMQGTHRAQHAQTLAMLASRGMVSGYHVEHGCEHGEEPVGTLRWVGRGGVPASFQCDFVFVSDDLRPGLRAQVGAHAGWIGPGMSDHAPVIVDLLVGSRS